MSGCNVLILIISYCDFKSYLSLRQVSKVIKHICDSEKHCFIFHWKQLLLQHLSKCDYKLIHLISKNIKIIECDKIAHSLENITSTLSISFPISLMFVDLEIDEKVFNPNLTYTPSVSHLFRSNTFACKFITQYIKNLTSANVCEHLLPLVNKIVKENIFIELDPHKLQQDDETLVSVKQEFFILLRELIDNIQKIANTLPEYFRTAVEALPDGSLQPQISTYTNPTYTCALTTAPTFIILRVVLPIFIAPDRYHDYINPEGLKSRNIRRTLVLLTKVVQTMSLQCRFGTMERYLQEINPVIYQLQPHMNSILHTISDGDCSFSSSDFTCKKWSTIYSKAILDDLNNDLNVIKGCIISLEDTIIEFIQTNTTNLDELSEFIDFMYHLKHPLANRKV